MTSLSPQQIEIINAHGPYNHSSWTKEHTTITNEERLTGRGDHLVRSIRKSIKERFSNDEISEMTIGDVGCYDGWILHQLSDLPFKRMVGIEPRQKNIDKGETVRGILGIKTRVEFQIGDINLLMDQKFDVIICLGLIHHLDSCGLAIRNLKAGCQKFLFIETICLSSNHITKALKKEIEMKDLVYNYKEKICGISGHKFESSYSDGSAMELSVVNIPSIETLKMNLELFFTDVKIVQNWQSYRNAFQKYDRHFNAVCITAEPIHQENSSSTIEKNWINDYEFCLAHTVLKRSHVEPLYNKFVNGKQFGSWNVLAYLICIYLKNTSWVSNLFGNIIRFWYSEDIENEIIRNLKFNPPDKLSLEYGKILYNAGESQKAVTVLKQVTEKINADWRCVYRSFMLLYQIFTDLGDIETSERYKALCKTANPLLSGYFMREAENSTNILTK